uniref:RIN4 pathogenic type III effector avirulence factor Avr cleavage site domain-containing protein n=1 Tax=Manihot esculenta TaxID=3983 RepID=A0A2C9UEE0_MANES
MLSCSLSVGGRRSPSSCRWHPNEGVGSNSFLIRRHKMPQRWPLRKFGDVNDPASAEGFTVIFNKARDEK